MFVRLFKSRLSACLAATAVLLSGCVTASNQCGNEQRDWNNLQFPKSRYCSVPGFLPFAKHYEAANKAVCKVHDNNSGKYATMSQLEADRRFLCDYMKHSELPAGLRTVTGYMSYAVLRMSSPDEATPEYKGSTTDIEQGPLH